MKHRINTGIKMCAGIFAALLLAGCSTREQDKQPNAKQDVTAETEGEALVYKPTFIERVCELDAEDIIIICLSMTGRCTESESIMTASKRQ